jgi:hypothetical protein
MGNCLNKKESTAENNEIYNEHLALKYRTQDQLTAEHATTYLVTCMDFRLIDDICRAMDNMGYNNNYDQFIVAGASLGFCQNKYPHWRQTVLDHLEIGLNLHKFREFIFIDHLDCGAFKKFFPDIKTEEEEKECHKKHLQEAHDLLKVKFPDFKFQAFLMDLRGDMVEITIDKNRKNTDFVEVKEDNFLSAIDENLIDAQKRESILERKLSNRRTLRRQTTTDINTD